MSLVHHFSFIHPILVLASSWKERPTGHNSCSSTAATKRPASFMDKRPLWSDELSKYLEVSKRVKLVCQWWLDTCCLKLSIESPSIQVSIVLWWQTWQRFEFSASSSSSATGRWSKKGFSPENFNLIPDAAAGNVSPLPNDFEISVWHPSVASSLMAGWLAGKLWSRLCEVSMCFSGLPRLQSGWLPSSSSLPYRTKSKKMLCGISFFLAVLPFNSKHATHLLESTYKSYPAIWMHLGIHVISNTCWLEERGSSAVFLPWPTESSTFQTWIFPFGNPSSNLNYSKIMPKTFWSFQADFSF